MIRGSNARWHKVAAAIFVAVMACCWIMLICAIITPEAFAQSTTRESADKNKADGKVAITADPLGRETPRSAVSGMVSALAEGDYSLAGRYFDARSNGQHLAKELQSVLDAGGSLDAFGSLSNRPEGSLDDGLKADAERIGSLEDRARTPIMLVRGTASDGSRIWRVSQETSAAAHVLQPKITKIDEAGPAIAGASIGDWGRLIGMAGFVFLVFQIGIAAILFAIRKAAKGRTDASFYRVANAAMPPLSLLLATMVFSMWAGSMPVSIVARQLVLRYVGIFAWASLAWFLVRMVDAVAAILIHRMAGQERRQAISIVTLLRRATKVLLIFVAMVAVLDTLGVNVTTGIAALGVGGLALALGAQKTVENLVGSVTLIADKPVQVGDFCKVGDVTGTIEDIGIRSTRIRTLERTIVTIPNGDFSSRQIENFAKRDRFLFNPVISIEHGVNSAKLTALIKAIEDVILKHEFIIKQGARAKLRNFGASSLDIEIFAYIDATDFDHSVSVREDILIKIFRALEIMDVSIAIPTNRVHLLSGIEAQERSDQSGAEAPEGGAKRSAREMLRARARLSERSL